MTIKEETEKLRALLAEVRRRMPLDYQEIKEALDAIDEQSDALDAALQSQQLRWHD